MFSLIYKLKIKAFLFFVLVLYSKYQIRSFPNGRGSRVAGFKSRVAGFKKVAGFEKVAGFQKSRVVKRLYYMNITKNKIYTL